MAGVWSKVEGHSCLSRLWAKDLKLGVTFQSVLISNFCFSIFLSVKPGKVLFYCWMGDLKKNKHELPCLTLISVKWIGGFCSQVSFLPCSGVCNAVLRDHLGTLSVGIKSMSVVY